MKRVGIILAGGQGTRLYPLTLPISKQLMPVYDKPMIYYPLSVLMLAGITDILIITTPQDLPAFEKLLGDGHKWGISLQYKVQPQAHGIAQAYHIGADFVAERPSALILGDNIFFGQGLAPMLQNMSKNTHGASIFAYKVANPRAYGVVTLDGAGRATSLEEKPEQPKSNYAVTGLYFYDHKAVERAHQLRPSSRGEFEITDLNRLYMDANELHAQILGRGFAWLDTGTHGSLLDAANYVKIIEERQGLKICCPEEIAWRMGYIDNKQLGQLAHTMKHNEYGQYLYGLLNETSSS